MSNPPDELCPACIGTRALLLPTRDDIEEFPCPCCTRWGSGFPGLAIWHKHKRHWLIEPAEPNELAVYNGKPDL
jgi:hypothetical protein